MRVYAYVCMYQAELFTSMIFFSLQMFRGPFRNYILQVLHEENVNLCALCMPS